MIVAEHGCKTQDDSPSTTTPVVTLPDRRRAGERPVLLSLLPVLRGLDPKTQHDDRDPSRGMAVSLVASAVFWGALWSFVHYCTVGW